MRAEVPLFGKAHRCRPDLDQAFHNEGGRYKMGSIRNVWQGPELGQTYLLLHVMPGSYTHGKDGNIGVPSLGQRRQF